MFSQELRATVNDVDDVLGLGRLLLGCVITVGIWAEGLEHKDTGEGAIGLEGALDHGVFEFAGDNVLTTLASLFSGLFEVRVGVHPLVGTGDGDAGDLGSTGEGKGFS